MSRKARLGRCPPTVGDSKVVYGEFIPMRTEPPPCIEKFKSVPIQMIVETDYDKAMRELNEEFPGVRDIF